MIPERPNFDNVGEWHANNQISAGLFTKKTRTKPINDLYDSAEKNPNLELLQDYRLDDLNCAKLYSNPDMFFEIWKSEILENAKKEAKEERKRMREKRKKKGPERKEIVKLGKIVTYAV